MREKHNHYFKECPYNVVDIYRILEIFNVTDPILQHIAKKVLCAGNRGHKDLGKDIQDIVDSGLRWIEMRQEEQDIINQKVQELGIINIKVENNTKSNTKSSITTNEIQKNKCEYQNKRDLYQS